MPSIDGANSASRSTGWPSSKLLPPATDHERALATRRSGWRLSTAGAGGPLRPMLMLMTLAPLSTA